MSSILPTAASTTDRPHKGEIVSNSLTGADTLRPSRSMRYSAISATSPPEATSPTLTAGVDHVGPGAPLTTASDADSTFVDGSLA